MPLIVGAAEIRVYFFKSYKQTRNSKKNFDGTPKDGRKLDSHGCAVVSTNVVGWLHVWG